MDVQALESQETVRVGLGIELEVVKHFGCNPPGT